MTRGADKKNEKGFANLHYPGMKTDPDEGRTPLNESVLWHFAAQIEAIGEEAQRKLMSASVLILGATPLGVRLAKRLSEVGIGRIGVFGDSPATGAHQFTKPSEGIVLSAIAELKKWMKEEASWVQFEPFSGESLDRQLDDVVRGFGVVVATDLWSTEIGEHALASAKEHGIPFLSAQTSSSGAQLSTSELLGGSNTAAAIILDRVAQRIVEAIFTMALTGKAAVVFETIELKKDSWNLEVNQKK